MYEVDYCSVLFTHRSGPKRQYRRKIIPRKKVFWILTLFSLLGKKDSLSLGSKLFPGPWPDDQILERLSLGINDKTVEGETWMNLVERSQSLWIFVFHMNNQQNHLLQKRVLITSWKKNDSSGGFILALFISHPNTCSMGPYIKWPWW